MAARRARPSSPLPLPIMPAALVSLLLPLFLLLPFHPTAAAATVAGPERPPPNFLVILLDDAGWGDLGANWAETPETPVLDQLARQGLRFTDFHSAASVCTPSRASLLTGRLGLRTGVIDNFRQGSLGGLPLPELTLAEHLRDQGMYRTAMAGKWHLGTHPPYHPTYRGFQRYLGVPYSVDMGCTDVPGADLPARHRCCPFRPQQTSTGGKQQLEQQLELEATAEGDLQVMRAALDFDSDYAKYACFNAPAVPLYNSTDYACSGKLSCNEDIVEQPVNLTTLTRRYADYAEGFIEEHAALNRAPGRKEPPQPFFLYVAMAHMHVPLAYAPEFEHASPRTGDRRIYGNALAEADHEIGRIVQALHRTGLANDTLVFITSDNGPWDMKCDLAGLAGPYEGKYLTQHYQGAPGKFTSWEGGHRVPGIAYWPGTIAPGVTPALASTLDFFPTFSALAGLGLPNDRQYDGVDLSPLLLSPTHDQRTEERVLFHPDQLGNLSAMRVGNKKVHFRLTRAPPCVLPTREQPVLPDVDEMLADWQFVVGPQEEGWDHPHPLPLVFDLEADPQEAHPLSLTREEKARYEALLQAKLRDIETTMHSTVDYSKLEDPTGWPCCSTTQPDCGCDTWATYHPHDSKAVEW